MTDLRTAAQQALKELDALKQRGVFGDFDGVADNLRSALEPQKPTEYEVAPNGRRSAVLTAMMNARTQAEAALAEPVQEPVELVKHKHQWFSTGGMKPGEIRCMHCGKWGTEDLQ